MGKRIYCSCHPTWLPCKTAIRAQVICFVRLKIASFAFFTLAVFSRVCTETARVMAAIMLNLQDILDHNDFRLVGSKKLTFANLFLTRRLFLTIALSMGDRKQVYRLRSCHAQLRMRTITEQANWYAASFSFSDLKISNSCMPAPKSNEKKLWRATFDRFNGGRTSRVQTLLYSTMSSGLHTRVRPGMWVEFVDSPCLRIS